jgi:hypothetical protein
MGELSVAFLKTAEFLTSAPKPQSHSAELNSVTNRALLHSLLWAHYE